FLHDQVDIMKDAGIIIRKAYMPEFDLLLECVQFFRIRIVVNADRRLQQVFYPFHGGSPALNIEDRRREGFCRIDQHAKDGKISEEVAARKTVAIIFNYQHAAKIQDDGKDKDSQRLGQWAGQIPPEIHLVAGMEQAVVDPEESQLH